MCPAGVWKVESNEVSDANSPLPQLMETTETPCQFAAVVTAAVKSEKLELVASTSTILAPGARACAHSTSRASSTSQSSCLFEFGSVGGRLVVLPVWDITVKLGGSGR